MAVNTASPKKGKVIDIPSTTVAIGTAADGETGTTATVPFTPTTYTVGGPTTNYVATSTPGSFTGEGSSSPITVGGLTTATSYTFRVAAGNATGYGTSSTASNIVTVVTPPTSFESIATLTPTSGYSALFSGISADYKSLQLRIMFYSSDAAYSNIYLQFNGDTASNYSRHELVGSGSAASAYGVATDTLVAVSGNPTGAPGATIPRVAIVDIIDYASVTKYKTVKAFSGFDSNSANHALGLYSSSWRSTSAISSITVGFFNLLASPTSIALYGVK